MTGTSHIHATTALLAQGRIRSVAWQQSGGFRKLPPGVLDLNELHEPTPTTGVVVAVVSQRENGNGSGCSNRGQSMSALTIILTAVALVAATVGIHAAGTHALIRSLTRRFADTGGMIKPHKTLSAVIWTAIVLLVLHVIEIQLWALAYLFLVPGDQMDTLEEAVYFSFVTYTTLGYGDITLAQHDWRILSGVEALDGILLAGWSTALLFVVVQRSWRGIGRSHARPSADDRSPQRD